MTDVERAIQPLEVQLAPDQTEKAPGASGKASVPRLEALDAPRGIASVMIVCSHFFQPQLGSFARWGGCWTQFFFVLSGFVLAYVEMARSPSKVVTMSTFQYVKKRLITVYPTYIFTLVLSMFQYRHGLWAWATLPLNIALMHQWAPICWYDDSSGWPSRGLGCIINQWARTSWFMSVLVVYWMVLRPLASAMRRATLSQCSAIIVACWLWSGVMALPGMLAGGPPMQDALIMAAIQFGPLGYAHVFVCGVAAARLFILIATRDADTGEVPGESTERLVLDKERAPLLMRYGCVAGYLLYAGLVAAFPNWKEHQGAYWVMHNGGMLPVMLLILLGGAVGADPLACYVFQSRPFLLLGRISYAQYLLQFNVMDMCTKNFPFPYERIIFVVALPLFAYLTEQCFTRVFTEWLRLKQQKSDAS